MTPREAEMFYDGLINGSITELPVEHGRRDHDPDNGIRQRLLGEIEAGYYDDHADFKAALIGLCGKEAHDFMVEDVLDELRAAHERPMMTDAQVAEHVGRNKSVKESPYVANELAPERETA